MADNGPAPSLESPMSIEKEQEQIVKALQKRLNEAILEKSTPETLATLSNAVRQAADALKSLQSSYGGD